MLLYNLDKIYLICNKAAIYENVVEYSTMTVVDNDCIRLCTTSTLTNTISNDHRNTILSGIALIHCSDTIHILLKATFIYGVFL
jgi:hypothetical protein